MTRLAKVRSFWLDPGAELPGDLPKRTLLSKIRAFLLDPGPELPRDPPKRMLSKIHTFRPEPGPDLPGCAWLVLGAWLILGVWVQVDWGEGSGRGFITLLT